MAHVHGRLGYSKSHVKVEEIKGPFVEGESGKILMPCVGRSRF